MGIGTLQSFTLKVLTLSSHELALGVARSLPEWFSEKSLNLMALDFIYQRGAVAMDGENPIGFMSFSVNQGKAFIGWMGVLPDYQSQGVGKYLITKLSAELTAAGVSEISVRLLGESVETKYFESTREFFRAYGFKDADPSNNPLMVYPLQSLA